MYNGNEEPIDYILPKNLLYTRCYSEYPNFVNSLELRYKELRETAFSIDHLDSLLDKYFSRYIELGIDTMEEFLWSGHNNITLDIQSEQEYIHNWLLQRLDFLDEYYHYKKITTSYNSIVQDKNTRAVFDIFGRYVSDHIHGLPNGIYIYRHDGKVEKLKINN